jgi:ElaB/YqjD/DUF883 family membrane-anchored ribosome-binding protein
MRAVHTSIEEFIMSSKYPETLANGLSKDASSAANKVEGAVASASSEFKNFVADVEDLVKETTTLTGEDLARAKARLSERLAAAKQSAIEMGSDIAERAKKGATATNDYVHEQPWKAIGAGAAIGLVVGFLLARRG